MKKLIGPFKQILTLAGLPLKGSLRDDRLEIITDGGVLVEDGLIKKVGKFAELLRQYADAVIEEIESDHVLLPGFIDCHMHICFGGNRAKDYALRIAGKTYLEIAKAGGGIWDTVTQTRLADEQSLLDALLKRANQHLSEGITTIEVKSGYGLNLEQELKQLRVIREAGKLTKADLISTCLAAHMLPKDFEGDKQEYLQYVVNELLPVIRQEKLANRVDIFVEESAFDTESAQTYLNAARRMGFDITVHADQFTVSGSKVAVACDAVSADHLEASGEKEINLLAASKTVAVVLPGASLGLGMPYAPARKLLDAGACVAIASDWNPGSAPMGDLLLQASVMAAAEKLTTAEVFAGLTYRAAKALNLNDRGALSEEMLADMQAYPCTDHREILYYQGKLKAGMVWKKGERGAPPNPPR
jgi:imidazolonepropionase